MLLKLTVLNAIQFLETIKKLKTNFTQCFHNYFDKGLFGIKLRQLQTNTTFLIFETFNRK